jgi:hypothetical protein
MVVWGLAVIFQFTSLINKNKFMHRVNRLQKQRLNSAKEALCLGQRAQYHNSTKISKPRNKKMKTLPV